MLCIVRFAFYVWVTEQLPFSVKEKVMFGVDVLPVSVAQASQGALPARPQVAVMWASWRCTIHLAVLYYLLMIC